MISTKNLKFVLIPLLLLTLAYMFVEIPFVLEFLFVAYGLLSLNSVIIGLRFKSIKKDLVELGTQENFNGEFVSVIFTFIVVAIFTYFGTKLTDWDLIPKRSSPISPYVLLIILTPQFTQAIMVYVLNAGGRVYMTQKGMLLNMNTSEHFVWKDFDSYAVLPDLKLVRFRKQKGTKSKFFFVSYEIDDFEKNKKHILTILNHNLKRELG
mgnify:CR=1 FL=1